MAKAEDLSVSIEKAVHAAFAEMAQKIMDDHGVQVNNVVFDWVDVSDNNKVKAVLSGTNADTTVRI